MGQVAGVVEVPSVLEAVVLLDGAGVDQVNGKADVLQAIDQPVPVVGGLDGDALNLAGVAAQGLLNLGVVVGKSLAEHDAIRFIQHAQHAVVAVQVNGCVQCFVGLLRGSTTPGLDDSSGLAFCPLGFVAPSPRPLPKFHVLCFR